MSEENILIVKGILAPKTIIAGAEGYDYDHIYYLIKNSLFEAILKGAKYIKENPFVYKIKSIEELWNYIENAKDKLLDGLWKDPYISNDLYFNKYIDIIENALLTGLLLQDLEDKLARKHQIIRRLIQKYEPLAFVSFYFYTKKYREGNLRILDLKENKEKEDIKAIIRLYLVIRKYDLRKPIDLRNIYRESIIAIQDNSININKELEMIKQYLIINKKAKRKKKIIQLKNRKKEINEKIEILKNINPSNPEIQELEKEKREIEEQLEKLIKGKKIIKENIQNEQEKAKTENKELEKENGQ
ncbi:MAG: hypothetical protein RXQ77_03795 [Candidatus Nanopusillus sp.]